MLSLRSGLHFLRSVEMTGGFAFLPIVINPNNSKENYEREYCEDEAFLFVWEDAVEEKEGE